MGKFRNDTIDDLKKVVRYTWHKINIRRCHWRLTLSRHRDWLNKWMSEQTHECTPAVSVLVSLLATEPVVDAPWTLAIKHDNFYTILKSRVSQNHWTGAGNLRDHVGKFFFQGEETGVTPHKRGLPSSSDTFYGWQLKDQTLTSLRWVSSVQEVDERWTKVYSSCLEVMLKQNKNSQLSWSISMIRAHNSLSGIFQRFYHHLAVPFLLSKTASLFLSYAMYQL